MKRFNKLKQRKYYIFYATTRWKRGKKPIKNYRFAKKIVEDLKKKGVRAYMQRKVVKGKYLRA